MGEQKTSLEERKKQLVIDAQVLQEKFVKVVGQIELVDKLIAEQNG